MTKKPQCLTTLFGVLGVALGVLAIAVVSNSPLVVLDQQFEQYLFSIREPWLLSLFSAITFFGDTLTVGVLTLFIAGVWFVRNHKQYANGLLVAVLGSATCDFIMKAIVERARPSGGIPSITETSFSFPSGHATAAVALYGFLAYYLWKTLPTRIEKYLGVGTMLCIIVAIGFSRLYLGVHYPSDVAAGFLLGTCWLIIGRRIASSKKQP